MSGVYINWTQKLRRQRDLAFEQTNKYADAVQLAIQQRDQARAEVVKLSQSLELMRTNLSYTLAQQAMADQERDHLQSAIRNAVDAIAEDGGTDGAHHKQWVLDQVLHLLLGEGYDAWIAEYNKPGYIPWDTGVAP